MKRSCLIYFLAILLISNAASLAETHAAGQSNSADDDSVVSGNEVSNPGTGNFALVTASMRQTAIAYRYNTRTGEAWKTANTTIKWTKVVETAPITNGRYEIQIAGPFGPSDEDGFLMTIRIDLETGRTWYEQNDKWKPHVEPSDEQQPE